jgi:uncharacterized protein YcgI (DUF1989 family)
MRDTAAVPSTKTSITSIAVGQAWAGLVPKHHHLRIRSTRIVHLVAFSRSNPRDRLDDSRSKGNAGRMFVTVGSKLISKFNRDLLQIVADNSPPWSHDFLTGLKADFAAVEPRTDWARLARALSVHNIQPDEIPTTLNLFSRVTVDGETGRLSVRPGTLGYTGEVELRAEADCIVGLCVSSQQTGSDEGAEIALFQSDSLIQEMSHP